MRAWFTVAFLLWLTCGCQCQDSCTAVIGERYEFNVSISSTVTLCFPLSESLQSEAIRVLVSSENATTRHPVLVTVRQPMGVVSWAVPYIESGFSYSSVERTLCPLLNVDDESAFLLVDLSTSQTRPLLVSMVTTLVRPFKLTMNDSVTLEASPSGPSYLMYEAPTSDLSRVRVQFQSSDNTSHICAIASIQSAFCPVVELLDNPDHRGRYQTMKSTAAINTMIDSTRRFFYVVVTVFPHDGSGCVFNESNVGFDNYDPIPYPANDRVKIVTITVEPALSDSAYAIAVVVSIVVFVSFYIIAVVWILVFDWWRFYTNYFYKQAKEFLDKKLNQDGQNEQTENPSDMKPQPVRQDSSDEEEENYKAPPTQEPQDIPDWSVRSSIGHQRRVGHHQSDASEKLVKRPSMLSVLRGTHLKSALNITTPSSSQQPFPHGRRTRHISENTPPSLTPATSPREYASLTPLSIAPLRFKRQKSVSESFATPTTHSLMPFPGYRSPMESHGNHMLSVTSPSMSHGNHMLRFQKPNSISSPESTDNGTTSITMETTDGVSPVGTVTTECVGSVNKQSSYTAAVEEGQVMEREYYNFPINVNLAEVGDIDDSAYVQKKYNRYALYLLIVIVFYSIPAYQLVVTYQRLLTSSGNEDLCYYNSLCAHPWAVYSGLTLSAFNNIFSNIGFFVLGLLYMLVVYRRRTMYESIEEFNCQKARSERVGIPQHFGIHYAIGLSLMAEALMSVAYHICPSNTNYQFDTTFMYILAALGLHKLLENRCPDLEAGLHKIMLTLAFIIVVVVVGVLYSESLVFWILFFVVYVVFSFVFSVEMYYRWQLGPRSAKDLFIMYKKERVCPPKHIPKFVMAVFSILFNWIFGLGLVIIRPIDFATVFLFILLSNFILHLLYYAVVKMVYRERPSVKPLIFVILAVLFWIGAIFFYTRTVTDWTVSPALSRDKNTECILLEFYDAHDMWHFLSAFALFFSFLMLMTLDDKQEYQQRTSLRAF